MKSRRKGWARGRRRKLRSEQLESRLLLASDVPFQNPGQQFDVSRDLRVSALDALQVINFIADNGQDFVLPAVNDSVRFPDVNGSNSVTTLDALQIINRLSSESERIVAARLVDDSARGGQQNLDFITNAYSLEFGVTRGDGSEQLEVRIDGQGSESFVAAGTVPADNPLLVSEAELNVIAGGGLVDGDYLFEFRIDGEDRVESFVVTIDQTAPPAPTIQLSAATDSGASDADGVTNIATVDVEGDAETNSLVAFFVEGAPAGQTIVNSPFQFDNVALLEGPNSLSVTATDIAGNESAAGILQVQLDTIPPSPPTEVSLTDDSDSGSSNSDELTNLPVVSIEGAEFDGETLILFSGSQLLAQVLAGSGNWQADDIDLVEGNNSFTALIEDAAGNVSDDTTLSVTLDIVSPRGLVAAADTETLAFVELLFDEPMGDTVNEVAKYSIAVSGGASDGQLVALDSVERFTDSTVRIHVTTPLEDATGYRLTVDGSIDDRSGNQVGVETEFSLFVAESLTITDSSPINGEEMVGLEREAVVRFSDQIDPSTIDSQSIRVTTLGELVAGRNVVSSTDRFVTFFPDQPWPAGAEVRIEINGNLIHGRDGSMLDADQDGQPGGQRIVDFRTMPLTRVPGTDVFGFVYDSFNRNPDGSDIPIQGATIRVDALAELTAVTDADGRFVLEDVPSPEFFVHVDGSTASTAPAGFAFPSVGKKFHSVPGRSVQLNHHGHVFDIYLPPMAVGDLQALSAADATDIGFGDASLSDLGVLFPAIPSQTWDQVAVTFPAGSAVDPLGNAATEAIIIPVAPDRLPAPLPAHINPQLVISIQAPGATNFDVPAPVTFPNLDALALGTQASLWSFNHDLGDWAVIGTGTVVDDGNGGTVIQSDPGVGILAPGWHTVTPPSATVAGEFPPPGGQFFPPDVLPEVEVKLLPALGGERIEYKFSPPQGGTELVKMIEIKVMGDSFDTILDAEGPEALRTESIILKPGDPEVVRHATSNSIDRIAGAFGSRLESDVLYGALITVDEVVVLADGAFDRSQQALATYFYADQLDAEVDDAKLTFPDTVITGDVTSQRALSLRTAGALEPTFVFEGPTASDFSSSDDALSYNPEADGPVNAKLKIAAEFNGVVATSSESLQLGGTATKIQRLFVNTDELLLVLDNLSVEWSIKSLFPVGAPGTFTLTFAGAETTPIRHDASSADVRAALAALPTVGPGNVRVSRYLNDFNPAGTLKRQFYEVEFLNTLEGTSEVLTGTSTSISSTILVDERISHGEWNFLTAPATRAAIAEAVESRLEELFGGFSNGIEVVDQLDTGINTVTLRWDHAILEGRLGTSKPGGGIDNLPAIKNVVADLNNPFVAQAKANSLIDTALNRNFTTIVKVFVDTVVESRDMLSFANPVQAIANTFAKTAAHEVGHSVGALHTWKRKGGVVREVVNNGVQGRTDMMRSGVDFNGNLEFRDSLTSEVLRLALNLGWTQEQAKLALNSLAKNVTHPLGAFDSTEEFPDAEDLNLGPVSGPRMFLFDENGDLVRFLIELDPVLSDGPGSTTGGTTLQLSNGGDQPIVINEVSLQDTSAAFAINAIAAGTQVPPGDTLAIQVTFDPTLEGPATAQLVIDSNDPIVPRLELPLNGFGVATEPRLHLETSSTVNNFGGVEVGTEVENGYTLTAVNHGIEPLTILWALLEDTTDFSLPTGTETTLAFGEQLQIPVSFHPSEQGLKHALVELTTNDPSQTVVHQGVVGTGIPVGGVTPATFQPGEDYAVADVRGFVQRTTTNFKGGFQFQLAAELPYNLSVFDPESGLIASTIGFAGQAGSERDIVAGLRFQASVAPDTDFDGLPDDVEFAVGTNIAAVDTDDDGADDFAEVDAGLNPLDGIVFPTGVIASLGLPGTSHEVLIHGDADQQLAYVATGDHGLAIVDVTKISSPILLGQLDLTGEASDVSIDEPTNQAVVATGAGGLQLVDISDPMIPRLVRTLSIPGTRVEVVAGIAYVGSAASLTSVDVATGEVLEDIVVSAPITDIATEGTFLYTMNSDRVLRTYAIDGVNLNSRGSVELPDAGGRLFVGDSIAYAAAASFVRGGFSTADVSDGDNPRVISGSDVQSPIIAAGTAVAPNGSGLGVLVGTPDATSLHTLSVLDLTDLEDTFVRVGEFPLPSNPNAVAYSAGLAFVADDVGLQVVNILPFDNLGQPPNVSISTPVADVDSATAGVQIIEGTTVPVRTQVTDDVQLREVQLLVNGLVVQNDLSFPWNLSTIAPDINGSNVLSLQVRAIDTGGNEAISNSLSLELVEDNIAPMIDLLTPGDGSTGTPGIQVANIEFSEPMDAATLNASTIRLTDGTGDEIAPTDLRIRTDDTRVRVTYPSLDVGSYLLTINAAAISDRAGNVLGDSNVTSQFTLQIPDLLGLYPNLLLDADEEPEGVAIGDLNGDNKPDVVSANRGNSTVSIYLADGEGGFLPRTDLATTVAARSAKLVYLEDLNADDKLDMIVMHTRNQVATLIGVGDGSFAAPVLHTIASSSPALLQFGKVDADEHLDILAFRGAQSTLLVGAGDGTFTRSDVALSGSQGAALADFNNDGKLDVVAEGSRKYEFFAGKGDGTFEDAVTTATTIPVDPQFLVAGDFNNDQKLDFAATNPRTFDVEIVSLFLGNNDGTFSAPVNLPVEHPGKSLVAVDLNLDGTLDLAVANDGSAGVSLVISDGQGGYDSTLVSSAESAAVLAIGDLNDDGLPDLVTPNSDNDTLQIQVGIGGGQVGHAIETDLGARNSFLSSPGYSLADFGDDDIADLVVLRTDFAGRISVFRGIGDGRFGAGQDFAVERSPKGIVVDDFDGNDQVDVATFSQSFDSVSILLGNGADGFARRDFNAGDAPELMASGDVTGDGFPDLVTYIFVDDFVLVTNRGDGTFNAPQVIGNRGQVHAIELIDVNGDDRKDIVNYEHTATDAQLVVQLANDSGGFDAAVETVTSRAASTSTKLYGGDLNHDGNQDVIVALGSSTDALVFLSNGDGTFTATTTLTSPNRQSVAAITDADLDGHLDLMRGLDDGKFQLFRGSGDGTFADPIGYFPQDATPAFVLFGDVDGDADLDFVSGEANVVQTLLKGSRTGFGGDPLTLDGGAKELTADGVGLDVRDLSFIYQAAISSFAAVGLVGADSLPEMNIGITDLEGDLLGLATSNVIWIDRDAAGVGWYVDATPDDDREFAEYQPGDHATRVDLLTVVLHEIGHLLGLENTAGADTLGDLMSDRLSVGTRRLPTIENIDAYFRNRE